MNFFIQKFSKIILFIVLLLAVLVWIFILSDNKSDNNNVRAAIDLAGYWNFDDGSGAAALDFSGNNNMGILTNGPVWAVGKVGNALSFDGVDDYVNVGNGSSLNITNAVTLEAWVKTQSLGSTQDIIFSKYSFSAKKGIDLLVLPTGAFQINIGNGTVIAAVSSGVKSVNTWYHVAGVFDGSNIFLYVNNVLEGSGVLTGPILNDITRNTYIGRYNGVSNSFNGFIDEVKIYNRALSAEEIFADYSINTPVPTPVLTLAPAPIPSSVPNPVGQTGSWDLVFRDEFNGSALDLNKWRPNWLGPSDTAITKPVNSAEQNCYDPNYVSVANGELNLTGVASPCVVNNIEYPYRSGLVESNGHFNFTYGYMEARLWTPAGTGVWPAFWSNGQNWPTDGEIDVLEAYGTDASSYHYHYEGCGGNCGPGGKTDVLGATTGWHTYAADWKPGMITWYYDGQQVWQYATSITSSPMYLILNLGLKSIDSSVPATLKVDYVRVWKQGIALTTPSPSPTPVSTSNPSFSADLNSDGLINSVDFGILMSNWSSTAKPKADINQDGIVNSADLGIMMSDWGG